MTLPTPAFRTSLRRQRGVATLVTTLVILFILTLIVLSSSNVALFEQKTSTNENRQRLADQAAEYGLRLAGEYMKANIVNLASEETSGWLAAGTTRWLLCSSVSSMPDNHPCKAEPIEDRRNEMYYYSVGSGATANDVPITSVIASGAGVTTIGGAAAFPVTTHVNALLCRLDTTTVDTGDDDNDGNTTEILPSCRATPDPDSSNRIAITLVSTSTLTGEGAIGMAKETWANYDTFSTASSVPLVASGTVDITGNVTIVTAPNGGGTGIPVSIWTPEDADVDCSAGGSCASISTCQLGEFIQDTPESTFKTVCPTTNNACGCPSVNNASSPEEAYAQNPDMLSGKIPSSSPNCCENVDILDRDSGIGANPDVTFYPGDGIDNFTDLTDDSMFEWVFGVDYESNTTRPDATTEGVGNGPTLTNCGPDGTTNCALYALGDQELGATFKTCAELNALGAAATGLYYITDSAATLCTLPAQVGTPDSPAIVVVDDQARINGSILYGMLFVRSDNKDAELTFTGNADIYGALVVEGEATGHGNVTIVYIDTSASGPGKKLPESTRLGRVSGSWLDSTRGGF